MHYPGQVSEAGSLEPLPPLLRILLITDLGQLLLQPAALLAQRGHLVLQGLPGLLRHPQGALQALAVHLLLQPQLLQPLLLLSRQRGLLLHSPLLAQQGGLLLLQLSGQCISRSAQPLHLGDGVPPWTKGHRHLSQTAREAPSGEGQRTLGRGRKGEGPTELSSQTVQERTDRQTESESEGQRQKGRGREVWRPRSLVGSLS